MSGPRCGRPRCSRPAAFAHVGPGVRLVLCRGCAERAREALAARPTVVDVEQARELAMALGVRR